MIIPSHIQIETINGICTARCTMCTIEQWKREKKVMTDETFFGIIKKLVPYKDSIQYITVHGCGEPLLDKNLPEKIRIVKENGLKGTGFASNCTELTEKMSLRLLEAGLDTIICSIDGIDKETHEKIRVGTNFDKVVRNVEKFIELRNLKKFRTRVMIRFVRQEVNYTQWSKFQKYWEEKLNAGLGDIVVKFDVHNWGDDLAGYEEKDINANIVLQDCNCDDLSSRLFIYSDGSVGFCCADDNGFFDLGNVIEQDPIELFNHDIFKHYRDMMDAGKISELEHCKNCTIPRSRYLKEK